MKAVSCNLCGSDEQRLLFTGTDRDLPDTGQCYSMQQCKRCGLMYLSPRPDTPEEFAAIYPFEYDSYMKQGQRLTMALRRLAWHAELREIVRLTALDGHILEVGCATGEYLCSIRALGRTHVVGLEFSPQAAEAARRRHGLDVRTGDLLDAGFPDAYFDLIILRHVLEHVTDPVATMREIQRILRPGGCCIFTIPNPDSHSARLFGRHWYGWTVPRHLHNFPHHVLMKLLDQTGLYLAAIKYVATPNAWIGSMRFWLTWHGMRRLGRLVRYENPLALALFAPLGLVSAFLKASGTVRVIAKKPA